jgi:hypothetical protein
MSFIKSLSEENAMFHLYKNAPPKEGKSLLPKLHYSVSENLNTISIIQLSNTIYSSGV